LERKTDSRGLAAVPLTRLRMDRFRRHLVRAVGLWILM
jgi:hypothetical protein